jgi:hypothetical protein
MNSFNCNEKLSIDELSSVDFDSIPDPLADWGALLIAQDEQEAKEASQAQDLVDVLAKIVKRAEIICRLREGKLVCQAEVDAAGFVFLDSRWTRGYVSRKSSSKDRPAYLAGGARKGLIAVRVPSWDSTRLCRVEYYRAPL